MLDWVPAEIIDHIFSFLSNADWGRCQRVCQRWRLTTSASAVAERKRRIEWRGKRLERPQIDLYTGIVGIVGHLYSGKSTLIGELVARLSQELPLYCLYTENYHLYDRLSSRIAPLQEWAGLRERADFLKRASALSRGLFVHDDLRMATSLYCRDIHRARHDHLCLWSSVFVSDLPMMLWLEANYLFLKPGRLQRHVFLLWSKLFDIPEADQAAVSLQDFLDLLERCRKRDRWLVIDMTTLLRGEHERALFVY